MLTFQWQVNWWRADRRHQRHVFRLRRPFPSPDYLSARFARRFFSFFSSNAEPDPRLEICVTSSYTCTYTPQLPPATTKYGFWSLDHATTSPLNFSLPFTPFEPCGAVFMINSKIHLKKNSSNEYFKAILHYFRVLFTLGLYNGRLVNALIFFFVALAEIQVAVLSVLNLPRQAFLATCRIGHCCVCSPLLFASERLRDSLGDSPTYSEQKPKSVTMLPGNPKCRMTSCWMASLGFVYGLLLGNCGYQTDWKKDLLPKRNRSPLAILAWCARQNYKLVLREKFSFWPSATRSLVLEYLRWRINVKLQTVSYYCHLERSTEVREIIISAGNLESTYPTRLRQDIPRTEQIAVAREFFRASCALNDLITGSESLYPMFQRSMVRATDQNYSPS